MKSCLTVGLVALLLIVAVTAWAGRAVLAAQEVFERARREGVPRELAEEMAVEQAKLTLLPPRVWNAMQGLRAQLAALESRGV